MGKKVTLVGLTAKPALNGSEGVVLQRDSQSGRWGVQLASGKRVALRRTNLLVQDQEAQDSDSDDGAGAVGQRSRASGAGGGSRSSDPEGSG